LDHLNDEEDESLLLAMNIPVPDEGESDRDDFSPVTFSSPFEIYSPDAQSNSRPPISPRSSGAVAKSHPISVNSPPASAPQPIAEDAMRARAEQAESAAERLLELVEPDEEGVHEINLPSALLLKNGHSDNVQTSAGSRWTAREPFTTPKTPVNRAVAVRTQAAQFQDSPVANGSQFSLLNLITNKKHEKGWWVKRMTCKSFAQLIVVATDDPLVVQHGTPLKGVGPVDRMAELQEYTSALESGSADLSTIQKLALLCVENPVDDVSPSSLSHSPSFEVRGLPSIGSSRQIPSLGADMWADGKNCDRLFTALVNFLVPTKVNLYVGFVASRGIDR
jgi:CLIP-associating protein 1/2